VFHGWQYVEQEQVLWLLRELKDFFADPSKWVYHPQAVDQFGLETNPIALAASKWSLMGAGQKLAEEKYGAELARYIDCAAREYLNDLVDGKLIKGMTYDDEYALLCLGLEQLEREITE
jgi:hypothetical protein